MTDTPSEIAEMVRVRLMALSGAERFRMVLASLPPGLTEAERRRRLFERLYGEPPPLQSGI